MPLTPGSRLGTYEILAPLGAGGMGEVYRARDLRLGREVALKVLPAEMSADAERLARFEREARTVAALNHPNIVTLFSVEDDRNTRFLTMELVDGQSLHHAIEPGGLAISRVIELGIALADALAAAHEKRVVHRDLKPGNVMLTRDGRIKVLDFGLAKPAASELQTDLSTAATVAAPLSEEGQVVGTVPYMAPEQLRGEGVDARTDLFSLGVMLYELAIGKRPFTGATLADVSSAILRDRPQPLAQERADLPADLDRIVGRCLEKDPRERFQTALDVSNELRRLRKELERRATATPPKPDTEKAASIAVLPFVNRSASADDEYFSDGLADELLSMLAKIKGLRVIGRASSSRFKGTKEDPATIGAQLQVATLLDGSVRKSGNRVRISVHLLNAADGVQLWSETYDRSLDDIFLVQEDIAQAVVKELRTTLLGESQDSDASGRARADVAAAAGGHGGVSEAHRLYLQGKYFLDRQTQEDAERGVEYLKEAVKLDPTHVHAWLELSRAHGMQAGYGWGPIEAMYLASRQAVNRALELAPDSAEALARLANLQIHVDWDWKGAETLLHRALELSPGNDAALRSSGSLAIALGRLEAAQGFLLRAIELDPLSAAAYHYLGLVYQMGGRFAESHDVLRKALEISPQRSSTRATLALTLLAQGRREEALAAAALEPEGVYRLYALAIVHHAMGRSGESDAALRELSEKYADGGAYQIAVAHAARGEADRAFEWLERARLDRDAGLSFMRADYYIRSLHGDPRWGELLKRLGLEG